MGLLIDSSVLIAVERGQLRADTVAGAARPEEPVAIAATAVHLDYRVATRDRRSFARIDGLAVEYL